MEMEAFGERKNFVKIQKKEKKRRYNLNILREKKTLFNSNSLEENKGIFEISSTLALNAEIYAEKSDKEIRPPELKNA